MLASRLFAASARMPERCAEDNQLTREAVLPGIFLEKLAAAGPRFRRPAAPRREPPKSRKRGARTHQQA